MCMLQEPRKKLTARSYRSRGLAHSGDTEATRAAVVCTVAAQQQQAEHNLQKVVVVLSAVLGSLSCRCCAWQGRRHRG